MMTSEDASVHDHLTQPPMKERVPSFKKILDPPLKSIQTSAVLSFSFFRAARAKNVTVISSKCRFFWCLPSR